MVAAPKTRPKRNPSEASASASSSSVCLVAATAAAPRSSHFWLMAWRPGQAHGQQLRWAQVSWSRSMGGHERAWQIHLPNERAGPVDIYDEQGVDTASRLDLTWLGLSEAETETGPRSTGRGEEPGTGTAQHCQGINFLLASLLFLYLASHLTWDLSCSAVWPPSKMICCVIYGNATSQFLYSFLFSFFFSSLQFVIMAVNEIYELHIRFVALCLLRLQLPAVTLGNNVLLLPVPLPLSFQFPWLTLRLMLHVLHMPNWSSVGRPVDTCPTKVGYLRCLGYCSAQVQQLNP